MTLNMSGARSLLQDFDFTGLFVEELGWSNPSSRAEVAFEVQGRIFRRKALAELSGVLVFEVRTEDGTIPDKRTREAVHRAIEPLHHEHLLVFVDGARTQSLWYGVKRDGSKRIPREHLYVKGQPGDLFLSKLGAMVVDLSELEEHGTLPVVEVAKRLREALDVEKVTKKFFVEFREQHIRFLDYIKGIDNERDRQWYASVLLNRLMFTWFLQRKGFLDRGDLDYLQRRLRESRGRGQDRYYDEFLRALFFEGFAGPKENRTPKAKALVGDVPYLNGGLFLIHRIEQDWPDITVADAAFDNLFGLFAKYSWNLDDTPGGEDNDINPDVLGYIFEKYINQKAFGAYYTRPEITSYLCEHTIHKLILDRVNTPGIPGVTPLVQFDGVPDLLMGLDAALCRKLLHEVLPSLTLLDPARGSGAFLIAALKTLVNVYSAVIGRVALLNDANLSAWYRDVQRKHPSVAYYIKKKIITENLYGVDIMEEATEIARLRLFLALVTSVERADQLEPLPNIDFNILAGNSLIGLLHVDEESWNRLNPQASFLYKRYPELVEEKNRRVHTYRGTADDFGPAGANLRALRDSIDASRREAADSLDEILLDAFKNLGIRYEKATWDAAKHTMGKPTKRTLRIDDIKDLHPFHWGYEFSEVLSTAPQKRLTH